MKCQKCGKNNANVIMETNINGSKDKKYLCEICAQNIEMPVFNDIIEEMLDFERKQNELFKNFGINICESCGTIYSDFINGINRGCINCNNIFWPRFKRTLDSSEKSYYNKNMNNKFAQGYNEENILLNLKKELEKAIEDERYEDAAKIRDEIKEKSKKI